MRITSWAKTMSILGALVLTLGACAGGVVTEIDHPAEAPIGVSSESAGDPVPQAGEPELAPTAAEESTPRVPRENLEATDPAVVVLASGQPQIVEFFAFW